MMTMKMNLIPQRGCKALASPFWAERCFLYTGWRLFCWLTVGVGAHVALFAFVETKSGGSKVYFLFDIINSDGVDDSLLLEMVNFDVWSFCYFLCGPSLQISCWAPLKSYSPHVMLILWPSEIPCLWAYIGWKIYWCMLCIPGSLNLKTVIFP